MSAGIYLVTTILFLGTIAGTVVLAVWLRGVSVVAVARERALTEAPYRSIAEGALSAQAEVQASLTAIQAELARVSARLASVETMLQQV